MSLNTRIEAIHGVDDIRVDRRALARQQFTVSLGAVALMAALTLGFVGLRTGGDAETVAHLNKGATVVQTTAREIPSNPMQAIDRSHDDRRS